MNEFQNGRFRQDCELFSHFQEFQAFDVSLLLCKLQLFCAIAQRLIYDHLYDQKSTPQRNLMNNSGTQHDSSIGLSIPGGMNAETFSDEVYFW